MPATRKAELVQEVAESPVPPAQPAPSPRVVLDPDTLTMGDMMRARKMFAGLDSQDPWSGSDPLSLLAGTWEESRAMIIWCIRSRTVPAFTWEQACAVPLGELDLPEEPPLPPVPGPTSNGSGPVETP